MIVAFMVTRVTTSQHIGRGGSERVTGRCASDNYTGTWGRYSNSRVRSHARLSEMNVVGEALA